MPTYIGENKIVDRYLGDKFLEAAYIGNEKVYDPYTEITGYLPMIFKSRAAVALKNYRIHGTSAGAGVETENLWDNDDFWDNGHIFATNTVLFGYAYSIPPGAYTVSTNVIDNADASIASIFAIAATLNQDHSISSSNNGVFINRPRTVTVGENQVLWIIIRVANGASQDYLIWNKETFSNYWIMLTSGSTAPTTYIPFGYKIPILNTSGVMENLVESIEQGTWSMTGFVKTDADTRCRIGNIIDVIAEQSYTIHCETSGSAQRLVNIQYKNNSGTSIGESGWQNFGISGNYTVTVPSGATKITIILTILPGNVNCSPLDFPNIMFVQGSTAPDHYIPHRYESNYDLFIGFTKLGAEEYLDYGEQKVWKRTENLFNKETVIYGHYISSKGTIDDSENWVYSDYILVTPSQQYSFTKEHTHASMTSAFNAYYDIDKNFISVFNTTNTDTTITIPQNAAYIRLSIKPSMSPLDDYMCVDGTTVPQSYIPYLQPTNPPAPLPAINTYKGENTLSSTETVGEVTVKGRISASNSTP